MPNRTYAETVPIYVQKPAQRCSALPDEPKVQNPWGYRKGLKRSRHDAKTFEQDCCGGAHVEVCMWQQVSAKQLLIANGPQVEALNSGLPLRSREPHPREARFPPEAGSGRLRVLVEKTGPHPSLEGRGRGLLVRRGRRQVLAGGREADALDAAAAVDHRGRVLGLRADACFHRLMCCRLRPCFDFAWPHGAIAAS